MGNFEKWSYSRSESFSIMLPLASLQRKTHRYGGSDSCVCGRSVARAWWPKVFNSLFISPFFKLCRGKGCKKYFVTIWSLEL
jgi:hypothetical protein